MSRIAGCIKVQQNPIYDIYHTISYFHGYERATVIRVKAAVFFDEVHLKYLAHGAIDFRSGQLYLDPWISFPTNMKYRPVFWSQADASIETSIFFRVVLAFCTSGCAVLTTLGNLSEGSRKPRNLF